MRSAPAEGNPPAPASAEAGASAHHTHANGANVDDARVDGASAEGTRVDGGTLHGTDSAARDATRLQDALSRAIDVCLSAILLVLLAPLLALIALAVKLDSRGPALYRQRRVGHRLQPFTLNKFRTMHDGVSHDAHREFVLGLIAGESPQGRSDAESDAKEPDGRHEEPDARHHQAGGHMYKLCGDERVTRVGALLRRSSLDELPQLWNVLRGEMALVGPRPPIPYEVEHYPPHWFERFAVKPGITGLWQVSGRSQLTLEQMVALDVEYVRRRNLRLDLAIIACTLPVVLSGKGAS